MKPQEKDNISVLDPNLRDRLNSQREDKMLNPKEIQALHAEIKSASLALEESYASEQHRRVKKLKLA